MCLSSYFKGKVEGINSALIFFNNLGRQIIMMILKFMAHIALHTVCVGVRISWSVKRKKSMTACIYKNSQYVIVPCA